MLAYTTLVEVKRQLGGRGLPPYEPLTSEAASKLNSEFVAGMGALKADAEKGIQCPVCGKWFVHLGSHVSQKHREIGGAAGLKALLGYAQNAALVTLELHDKQHQIGTKNHQRGSTREGMKVLRPRGHGGARHGRGLLNLKMSCRAQSIARFRELRTQLGRQPTTTDWIQQRPAFPQVWSKTSAVFRKWNDLVIAAGGIPHKPGSRRRTTATLEQSNSATD